MAEVGLLPFARLALQVSKAVLPRYPKFVTKRGKTGLSPLKSVQAIAESALHF
jgi:hypothetical protein